MDRAKWWHKLKTFKKNPAEPQKSIVAAMDKALRWKSYAGAASTTSTKIKIRELRTQSVDRHLNTSNLCWSGMKT